MYIAKIYRMFLLILLVTASCKSFSQIRTIEEDILAQLIKKGITYPYLAVLTFFHCKDSDDQKIIKICCKLEGLVGQLKDILDKAKSTIKFNSIELESLRNDLIINTDKNYTMLSNILKLFQTKDTSILKLGACLLPIIPVLDILEKLLEKGIAYAHSEQVIESIKDAQKTIAAAKNINGSAVLSKLTEIKKKLEIVKNNYPIS